MDLRYECWQMPGLNWAVAWGFFTPHYFDVMYMTRHLASHLARA